MLGSLETLEHTQSAQEIVAGLPVPDYTRNYQPLYEDLRTLVGAVHEVQSTGPVTQPEYVMSLRHQLAEVAEGADAAVVMDGRCAEPIRLEMPIARLAGEALISQGVIAASALGRVVHIKRGCGQFVKPRSSATELLPNGLEVVSYMGDAVNDRDPQRRVPDPSRMVAGALQARDMEAMMTKMAGQHIMVGHEALLLAYELGFIRRDPETGREVSLAGDLLWLGVRTNDVRRPNPHIDMLARIENPVGVKVGPDSDEAHIAALAERLNPGNEPGKLLFMIRVGDNVAALDRIVRGIKRHAPGALTMFDIHGSTVKNNKGAKVRTVETANAHIQLLAEACGRQALRLDGIHIETIGDNNRRECVDTIHEHPTDKGDVDPQFNPTQTGKVLNAYAACR